MGVRGRDLNHVTGKTSKSKTSIGIYCVYMYITSIGNSANFCGFPCLALFHECMQTEQKSCFSKEIKREIPRLKITDLQNPTCI